jgi:amino acid transporter
VVSLLQAVGLGGWGFVGALAIGCLLMACNSATYAELALMMPRANGIGAYIGAGLGPLPLVFAVFAGYVVPSRHRRRRRRPASRRWAKASRSLASSRWRCTH